MKNSNEITIKHLRELSERAYTRNYHTFSEFLNLEEISALSIQELQSRFTLFGGYEHAERCIAGFGDAIDNNEFPISCIEAQPAQQKFADKLTHRDFLGMLMNLGINRNTLGDIIIRDNIGYIFCLDSISDYIIQNAHRVRHTTIKCEKIESIPDFMTKEPESEEFIVSSLRADIIICAVYNLSRNKTSQLFNQEKVFINSKAAYKESLILKENDRVTVRGYGKFIYAGTLRGTKKGKNIVEIKIYKQ